MIIWRDWPLTNNHPSPYSPLPGSRFNLADLSKTICSCYNSFDELHTVYLVQLKATFGCGQSSFQLILTFWLSGPMLLRGQGSSWLAEVKLSLLCLCFKLINKLEREIALTTLAMDQAQVSLAFVIHEIQRLISKHESQLVKFFCFFHTFLLKELRSDHNDSS